METLWATAITLFLIMDPLGNVPIFLVVLERVAEHRRRYIILRELIIALIVMLLFLFAGPAMLRTLGISPEAVALAGGVVLVPPREGRPLGGVRLWAHPPSGSMSTRSPAKCRLCYLLDVD